MTGAKARAENTAMEAERKNWKTHSANPSDTDRRRKFMFEHWITILNWPEKTTDKSSVVHFASFS